MKVNDLIKHLQQLVKEDKDIGEMLIRVIEEKEYDDDGYAKENFWIDKEEQIIIAPKSNTSLIDNYKGEIILRGEA